MGFCDHCSSSCYLQVEIHNIEKYPFLLKVQNTFHLALTNTESTVHPSGSPDSPREDVYSRYILVS